MADNTQVLDPSAVDAAGDTIATDDIGGVKFQRVKLVHGADGTNDGDVASTNPLPVAAESQTTIGGQKLTLVEEPEAQGVLNEILVQLKLMNLHLSVLSDNTFKETEVED